MPLLELKDVVVRYGGIEAVRGISLEVEDGESVTLIGGNGAGKSTTLKSISGVKKIAGGEIYFQGERIDGAPSHRIVEMGLCQVPEGRRIFPRMSVRENLTMGAYSRRETKTMKEDYERVFDLFEVLKEREKQMGGTLSGGEQQMLAVGRALMSHPKLLMLDEPSMGLAPLFVEKIFDLLRKIHEQGTTILLVEQNAQVALQQADRGYVLESGEIVLQDDAKKLLTNDEVRKAYLGES
ncbi:MAG: branched-chain amino acid transport system ATP-binding protein [Actinomycetota bacterium]|jgi:branched-chain amino acid transport system ATP-binding protein|nr:branched-chain amino acid transport system ATP-binding protein [Actinomycetota bacterium]